ncbi:MAG: TetR/AcrR family transcriptional regulator [Bifidobacteriaceae bacterium]|jgi:AcrR family transcriptional regulator|nr:TetR/AcrR family transcriptional regulator [Bifidobacteriaceae bacterium]
MPRGLTKKHDARVAAILDAAVKLFAVKGYDAVTVADILEAVPIGKGTFYHYFGSKEDVLQAVVERMTAMLVERAQAAIAEPGVDAHSKMVRLIAAINVTGTPDGVVVDELRHPANSQLLHQSLLEAVRQVAPIMAKVVEQGIAEGVYATPNPLESVEFLLVGVTTILDEGVFSWTPEQFATRAAELARITELVLGAKPGSFAFLAAQAGN